MLRILFNSLCVITPLTLAILAAIYAYYVAKRCLYLRYLNSNKYKIMSTNDSKCLTESNQRLKMLLVSGYCNVHQYTAYPVDIIKIIIKYCSIKITKNSLYKIAVNKNQISNQLISNNVKKIYRANKELYIVDDADVLLCLKEKTNMPKINNNYDFITNRRISFLSDSTFSKHLFFVMNNNNIYVKGQNWYGQTGLIRKAYEFNVPKREPLSIKLMPHPEILCSVERIMSIATGKNHSLFLSNECRVFGCGSNKYGQLLFSNKTKLVNEIRFIERLYTYNGAGIRATKICCTSYSSFVVNVKGELYGFGEPIWNVRGNNFLNKRSVNLRYICGHISDVQCGWDHFVVLENTGVVLTFGWNYNGQCAFKYGKFQFNKINNAKFIKIFVGYDYTFIMDKQYNLHVFGNNDNFQCLLDWRKYGTKIYKPQIIRYRPNIVKMTNGHRIEDIILTKEKTYLLVS
eukprot:17862_1